MSKIITALLLALFVTGNISAQSYLILKNGERIKFHKVNIKGDSVRLKTSPQQEKIIINVDEVLGYYSLETPKTSTTMYYLKPRIVPESYQKFEFIERVVEGKIKAYQKEFTIPSTSNAILQVSIVQYYLFLEKDNKYYNVLMGNGLGSNKKNKKEIFKDLVKDDKQIHEILNSERYNHKYESIKNAVKDYNIRAHIPNTDLTSEFGNVIFFRRDKRQNQQAAQFTVDSTSYTLMKNDMVIVKIPINSESKISTTNGIENMTDLIIGSKFYDKYYEFSFNSAGKISFVPREKYYYEFYQKSIENSIAKRKKK